MRRLAYVFLVILLGLSGISPAYAQKSSVTELSPDLNYTDISKKLGKIETSLKKGTVTSGDLSSDVEYINSIRSQLADTKKSIERDLRFVEKRIEALGQNRLTAVRKLISLPKNARSLTKSFPMKKGVLPKLISC